MGSPPLLGRNAELGRVDALVGALAQGPAALTLAGEAGIGKSILWLSAVERAAPVLVLTARAAEAETDLPYVALTDLLAAVAPPHLAHLPSPQAHALAAALLLDAPEDGQPGATDPRTLGTAVLAVLRRLAAAEPLLLALDDVQWLDHASAAALTFCLRRAVAEGLRIGVLSTLRTPGTHPLVGGLPSGHDTLALGPVSLGVLHQLLHQRLGLTVTRPQLVRLEQASGGNPLLALEIGRQLSRQERWPLPGEPLPVPAGAGGLITARIATLDAADRDTLFVAAAAGDPSTATVAAALERLPEEAEQSALRLSAPDAALLGHDTEGRWRVTHPLVAEAALAAPPPERRRVLHARLAALATTDEERGRHAALAADRPDAAVAALLDAAARSARRRGAPLTAASWAEAAADLTPADATAMRAARRLRAARWLGDSGDVNRAQALLQQVIEDLPPGDARADALELAAQMAGWRSGPAAVVTLAERGLGEARDPVVRGRLLLRLASEYDHVGTASALAWAAEAAQSLEAAGAAATEPDLLACALLQVALLRFAAGLGDDEEAVARACALLAPAARQEADGTDRPEGLRAQQDRTVWAVVHDRLEEGLRAAQAEAARARERGHDRALPIVEGEAAYLATWLGDLPLAADHARAAMEAAALSDHPQARVASLGAMAHVAQERGELDAAEAAAAEALAIAGTDGWLAARQRVTLGRIALLRADAAGATRWLGDVLDGHVARGRRESLDDRFAGDLVEAAVAAGDLERARTTVDLLEGSTVAMPRPWVRVMAARGRALVSAADGDLDGADAAIRLALVELGSLPMPLEHARTELVAARIARRRKERRRAADHLDRALTTFAAAGARAWQAVAEGERARLGLRAGPTDALTATEEQVARLAATGLTNREVGEAAFLTAKSVEGVLARAYRKLGIRSRAELGAWLAAQDAGAPRS